ncbi:3-ketoacyl-CoA synthase 5 [Hordeum vulgare]|nr:3-ketoacyl-CoA synthase 5 [Hordeum vulgare]
MRRGDRVWMIGFGSGFKCNSAVWQCIRSPGNGDTDIGTPWADSIHMYPLKISEGLSQDSNMRAEILPLLTVQKQFMRRAYSRSGHPV